MWAKMPLPLQRPTECSGGDLPVSRQSAAVLTGFLGSGVVARVAAATISQPTDGLLSKANKTGAGGDGPVIGRLSRLADGKGMAKLCTQGLFAFLRVHVVDWRVAFSLRRPCQALGACASGWLTSSLLDFSSFAPCGRARSVASR